MVFVGLDMVHECKKIKCQFQEMKEGSSRKILLMAGRLSRRFVRAVGVGRTARLLQLRPQVFV
jgi:hypothetical protein